MNKFFPRYAALAAIVFVWVLFVVGMISTHLRLLDSRPLSYLGVSDFAPYFKLGLLVGMVMMAAFYVYLKETFKPSRFFRNIYFIGLITQAIVTFTPYELNGRFQWPHWTAAFILAAALVFSPWIFASSQNITETTRKVSRAVTSSYLIILVIETALLVAFKYYVVSELLNLLIFHAWIIYLTFAKSIPR